MVVKEPMSKPETPETSAWLLHLLRRMDGHAGPYLGAEDVRTLHDFVSGYYVAMLDVGQPVSNRILIAFSEWLAATDDGREVGATPHTPWSDVIPRLDPSPRNVTTFYRLFRRFLAETGRPPL